MPELQYAEETKAVLEEVRPTFDYSNPATEDHGEPTL
jgi:hypothetical protein